MSLSPVFSSKISEVGVKNIRKDIIETITETIVASGVFSMDGEYPKVTRDENRYNEIPVRYPQKYAQAPRLRPFIKLELMETDLLEAAENRVISSLVMDLTKKGEVVRAFPCATIAST